MQAAFQRELSLALEQSGRGPEALAALRAAYAHETDDLRAQRDRGLAWSNARFNLSESQRQLAAAEQENRNRALLQWLTAVSAVAVIALLSLFFLRRQHRTHEAEAVRRARYEEALAHYKREADALAQDRRLLQALLDSRDEALALLDADGRMLTVNRAACALLGIDADAHIGQPLPQWCADEDAHALVRALEQMEDAPSKRLMLSFAGPARDLALAAELRQWEGGDGWVVMSLAARGAAELTVELAGGPADEPTAERIAEPPSAVASHAQQDDDGAELSRDAFRRILVELMLAVVDAWERDTGQSRIELAQRSRIWRVHIDDGRLRARSMERYLAVSKLPDNPRWRDVLRSAYYVLGQCEQMPAQAREELQQRIDTVLAYTRREALV
jgi:PAS domain-containing protein